MVSEEKVTRRAYRLWEDRKVQLLPKFPDSEESSSVKDNLRYTHISWMWSLGDEYKIIQQAMVTRAKESFPIPKRKTTC